MKEGGTRTEVGEKNRSRMGSVLMKDGPRGKMRAKIQLARKGKENLRGEVVWGGKKEFQGAGGPRRDAFGWYFKR